MYIHPVHIYAMYMYIYMYTDTHNIIYNISKTDALIIS